MTDIGQGHFEDGKERQCQNWELYQSTKKVRRAKSENERQKRWWRQTNQNPQRQN